MPVASSALVAILMALAFPPLGYWPLAILSFAFLSHNIVHSKAAWHLYFYSVFVNLFGFYWIAYTLKEFAGLSWLVAVFLFLLAIVILSFSSFFWGWAFEKIKSKFKPISSRPYISLFVFFLIWDFFDIKIYPWTPTMALGAQDQIMSSLGIYGTFGLNVAFFGLSVLSAYFFKHAPSLKYKIMNISSANILILGVLILGGIWNRKVLIEEYSTSQPIAILQGNIGNSFKKNAKLGVVPSIRVISREYRNLIEEASIHFASEAPLNSGQKAWYFWPETSYPGLWNRNDFLALEMQKWLELSKAKHIMGAYQEGQIELAGRKKIVDFNVMVDMEKDEKTEVYKKIIRMPFGEFIPGDVWFPDVYQYMSAIPHFGAGEEKVALNTDGEGPLIIPLICYEILFNSFVNDFVSQMKEKYPERSMVLVNPSNDSWYGLTSQPFQNAFLSRWHAARLKLPLVRPANTGISLVVAPWGEILAESHLNQAEVIYSEIPVK